MMAAKARLFGDSGTEERILAAATPAAAKVEASPVDRIWGIGLAAADPRAHSPSRWRGLKLLGFALMDARTTMTAAGM